MGADENIRWGRTRILSKLAPFVLAAIAASTVVALSIEQAVLHSNPMLDISAH